MLTVQEYHSFKIEFASMILPDGKMVGIDNAIFLQDIAYWCDFNKSSGSNFHDGRYWTYSTMDAIAERHPYWTKKQVRRIIDRCKEIGFLLVGNYNKSSYDRTIWYSVSDEVLEILNPANGKSQTGTSICPNGQMESSKQANGKSQMGTPIPNNKKDNKSNIKQIFNLFLQENNFSENLVNSVKHWIVHKKEIGQPYKSTGLKQFLTDIENYIEIYGEEKIIKVIEFSISQGYGGITWNRLENKTYQEKNYQKQEEQPFRYPTEEELRADGYNGL